MNVIKKKLKINGLDMFNKKFEIIKREKPITPDNIDYVPRIKDAKPVIEPDKFKFGKSKLYKVVDVLDDGQLKLDTGLTVKLKGIVITNLDKTIGYLKQYVLKKKVYLKFDKNYVAEKNYVEAYVYLKNKIFINAYLIKARLAVTDKNADFALKERFLKLENSHNLIDVNSSPKENTEIAP